MNELLNIDSNVGITKRPAQRRRNAPSTASVTLATVLGATAPAVAADASHLKIKTSEVAYSSELGTLPTTPAAVVVAPSKIDPVENLPAASLAESLAFAELVHKVMPVDEEMDRRAESALRRHLVSQPSRKLSRK